MNAEEAALIELSVTAELTARQVSKLAVAQTYFLAATEIIMENPDVLSMDALKSLKKALEKHVEFHQAMVGKRYLNSPEP